MKICIFGDNHWSQYSSILRQRGKEYSLRLENQIESINWVESLAYQEDCDFVVCLGDFFDSPNLMAEELTALKDVNWSSIPHYFLIGNHEVGIKNLQFSSSYALSAIEHISIVDSPRTITSEGVECCFLPYIFESDRKPISEYFSPSSNKRIIFSHNDIKGLQLGKFVSNVGFSIDDIESNCDLYINGHIHNGEKVTEKIINCGNLTGQNFGEDAFKYDHCALILDTNTMQTAVYVNPYAINFYKIDFYENSGIDYINYISPMLKNAVCSIRCSEADVDYLRKRFGGINQAVDEVVPHNPNVITARFTIVPEVSDSVETDRQEIAVDHLQMFRDYITETLGVSDVVISELQEICQ